MNANLKHCPECGGAMLYTTVTKSGGPYGPTLLPRLGQWLSFAPCRVVLCADCGLARFYAEPEALAKLQRSKKWKLV